MGDFEDEEVDAVEPEELEGVAAIETSLNKLSRFDQMVVKRKAKVLEDVDKQFKRFRESKVEESPLKKKLAYETLFKCGLYRFPEEGKVQTTPASPSHPNKKRLSKCFTK